MQTICDGMQYTFSMQGDDRATLRNNYGTLVATMYKCLATGEYWYATEITDAGDGDDNARLGDDMAEIHENALIDTDEARMLWLVGAYVGHTTN
jgi:hypothetical protein